ncbi:MAG: hypothetical protein CM1200mP16_12460 [Nitrospina sp.]|nr:MAG: hypothetical protein CM1200mP16_12460 [Nitrospina sp.]
MFPQTHHIETAVLLQQGPPPSKNQKKLEQTPNLELACLGVRGKGMTSRIFSMPVTN